MSDIDNSQPSGLLARAGQSDSFAGLARIAILGGGVLVAWAGFDFRSALDRRFLCGSRCRRRRRGERELMVYGYR